MLERIRRSGPLPFEEFMAAALYGPGGFFTGPSVRSATTGDFLTSPEVSPVFGQSLGRFVERERMRFEGHRLRLVEVGGGSGSLLGPLLEALAAPVEVWAVEASPPARAALADVVGRERVAEHLSGVPAGGPAIVIANEVLDNLPAAVAVRSGEGWEERWVAESGGELVLVSRPARPEVVEWLTRFAGPVADGGLVEVQLAAGDWVEQVMTRFGPVTLVAIDYGDTAEGLAPRRSRGTLRTYRSHHLGPDPLVAPGETDITSDVNFTALLRRARDCGAEVELHRQDDFLADLGLRRRLAELRHRELELARAGEAHERLVLRSRVTEAETLLHPRGLGDFRVMIARTSAD